jgi:hypothetical protein
MTNQEHAAIPGRPGKEQNNMNCWKLVFIAFVFFSLGKSYGENLSAPDRAYLIAHLEMTRDFVIDTTRGVTKEQWLFKSGPLRWSIAQCIDHLAQTEAYGLKAMRERVMTSEEPLVGTYPSTAKNRKAIPEKPRRMSKVDDAIIIRWMTDRSPAIATPVEQRPPIEEVAPRATFDDPQSVVQEFLNARAATLQYARTTNDDLRGHFIQAPMDGFPEIKFHDAYQWLLRISAHTERHLMQVQEVRRSAGYPPQP